MKKILASFLLSAVVTLALATDIYPTHWWTGMKHNKIQLIIHADGVGALKNVSVNYPGVKILKVQQAESPNYLFVDVMIGPEAKPGKFLF